MFDAVILTLGFEPGPLISAIASAASEGLSEGAQVIVLTAAFPDERAERAWLELQRILYLMDFSKKLSIRLERREIPLEDFTVAVRNVQEVLESLRDKSVKISITGGMRALGLAVFVSYLLVDWVKEPTLDVYLEGRGVAFRVPPLHKILALKLTETQRQILRLMRSSVPYTTSDIAGYLGKDRSTIYKSLKGLNEMGLVEREGNFFKLTILGELISASRDTKNVE